MKSNNTFATLLLVFGLAAALTASTANRLTAEKSPYLLQHADNPVDWRPWGEEALRKAKEEDKPIFLSIGYSTCHGCHVMNEESFSDPAVARLLNDGFISIMVDRQERPDLDAIYLNVARLFAGEVGWPLNVIMTPEGKPFYAASYLPKEDRLGRPGLRTLLPRFTRLWREQRAQINAAAETVVSGLQASPAEVATAEKPGGESLVDGYGALADRFDAMHGGFLPAPKFPAPHRLLFLLRYWQQSRNPQALVMVETTLWAMRRGGIFDQLGHGFHRYAADSAWQVPHFEKMLYDQALLIMVYIEAFQATGEHFFRATAEQILAYALRDLRAAAGAFHSAEDAGRSDSEGAYYRWTEAEIRDVVKADVEMVLAAYGFTGENRPGGGAEADGRVLRMAKTARELSQAYQLPAEEVERRLEKARRELLDARKRRPRPSRDDQVLADWNGLMIAALAQAAATFNSAVYMEAAKQTADFILARMRTPAGRLLHRHRHGEPSIDGYLDDYAFVIWGLLNLYEASAEVRYLEAAIGLEQVAQRLFEDERGGFFLTAADARPLLTRPKEFADAALPSGNSVQLMNLLRLGRMTADPAIERRAEKLVYAARPHLAVDPAAMAHLLGGLQFANSRSFTIVLAGVPGMPGGEALRRAVFAGYVPNKVVVYRPVGEAPITTIAPYTRLQHALGGQATAYICVNFVCKLPSSDPTVVGKLLRGDMEERP